jgi:hypothetical protein
MAKKPDIFSYGAAEGVGKDSFADIINLINSFEAAGQRSEARLSNKRDMIITQLDTANSSDDVAKLSNLVSSYDRDAKNLGYDEYSIGNTYQDKMDALNRADTSYEQAKAYQNENLGDEDALYDKIMGMSWGEANAEIAHLNGILDGMGGGAAYKHAYKPNSQYTGTSLRKSITTRIGQIQNKINIFEENQGDFLVYKEDGTFDEVSQQIYEDLQFKVLSGDTQDFDTEFEEMHKYAGNQYDKQEKLYLAWESVRQQVANKKDVSVSAFGPEIETQVNIEMDRIQQTKDDLLDPGWIDERVADAQNAADKYNRQYQILTGDKRATKSPWDKEIPPDEGDGSGMPGLEVTDPASMTGKGSVVEDAVRGSRFFKLPGLDKGESIIKELGENITDDEYNEIQQEINEGNLDKEDINKIEKEYNVDFEKTDPVGAAVTEEEQISEETSDAEYWKSQQVDQTADVSYWEDSAKEQGDSSYWDNIGDKLAKDDSFWKDVGGKPSKDELKYWEDKKTDQSADLSYWDKYKAPLQTTRDVALIGGGAAAMFPEQTKKATQTIYNKTKKAASWVKTATNFSAKDTDKLMKLQNQDKTVRGTMKSINKLEDKLENTKDSKKRADIKKQISTRKTNLVDDISKKMNKDPKDVSRMMKKDNLSKWNIVNVKDNLTRKLPKKVADIVYKVKPVAKVGAGVGLGIGQVRTGQAVADAFGLDLGEGFIPDVAEAAVGTTAAHQAVKQTTKRFLPKLGKMLVSDKGKEFLIKKLGKKAVAKIGTSVLAGGGIASLATGIIGLGLTARDIYKAVTEFEE